MLLALNLALMTAAEAEEKAPPVIDIDGTVLVQFALFVALYFILKKLFFAPYLEMRQQRTAGIDGVREKAAAMEQRATDLGADYQRHMQTARNKADEERLRLRNQGLDRERELLADTRAAAQARVTSIRQQIASEAGAAQAQLKAQALPLARQIARRVLGREVALALLLCLAGLLAAPPAHARAEETAIGETAHEGGGEPVIENWFSMDYGPGKSHKNPPFGLALINFAIFAGLLARFAGKPFHEFLSSRHLVVKRALDDAAAVQRKAQAELDRYENQIRKIDGEIDALLAQVRKDAEAERARIIAAAEAQAEQLRKDAESQIAMEIERARDELRRATIEAAISAAQQILKSQVNEGDQRRLVDDFVTRMEKQRVQS